jgi:ankyrin repeat protein
MTPTANEREQFKKATVELEQYVISYNKQPNLKSLKKKELNELFLDECYDYTNLSAEKVAKFLKYGADINCKDQSGLRPFHFAAKSDFVDVNEEFLRRGVK